MAEAVSDMMVLVVADRRADDGRRLVAITPRLVLIERRVCGVKMRIGVPVATFRGVALATREAHGEQRHVVTLVHRDPDLCVELEAAGDGAAMLLRQQHWAAYFGTRLLADAAVRPPRRRRRGSALRGRRPGILSRRKPGDLARLATVFDGTRELIAAE